MSTVLQRLNRPVVAILAVTAIAGVLRFTHLSRPPELFFDENYYAKSGCILIGDSDKVCKVDSNDEHYWRDNKWDVGSWVHPPLGKWTIGMGEKLFGVTPFGWRFSSAVAGTLIVTMVAILAQLLFGSALWTFVAGLLMAVESLNVVLSRSALLDIHLEFWVLAGFLLLLLDRRWIDRRTPPEPESEPEPDDGEDGAERPRNGSSPHAPERRSRSRSGVRGGSRPASRSAARSRSSGRARWPIIAALILSFAWETTRRRRQDVSLGRAFARAVRQESLGLLIAFVLLPVGRLPHRRTCRGSTISGGA